MVVHFGSRQRLRGNETTWQLDCQREWWLDLPLGHPGTQESSLAMRYEGAENVHQSHRDVSQTRRLEGGLGIAARDVRSEA